MSATRWTATRIPAHDSAGVALVMNAVDTSNGNDFVCTGHEILFVQNTDGSNAHTFVVTSQPDALKRTGNFSMSVPLSSFIITPRFPMLGWAASGIVSAPNTNNTNFKVAVISG